MSDSPMSERRTVLVTGAGGFIGGRIVEVLQTLDAGNVRAGLRRWGSGARVGRFTADLVKCDLRSLTEVRDAMKNVTHVVHCAVSMDHANTVDGTRNVMAAAKEAGVQRVVHLSTIDVYGTPVGEIDESHATPKTGKPYGDMKIDAEAACQDAAARGLPVTLLRPTLVHGPFSATWTIAYAQRLQSPPWLVAEADAAGTCNLIYVDDLVGFVMAALDAQTVPGEAFNVNGRERPTWNEYFHALNRAMGLPPLLPRTPTQARASARIVDPLRKSAKFLIKNFEAPIMGAYRRSDTVKTLMKRAERLIRTTPAPTEFDVYSRKASYSTAKAERLLGYRPSFALDEALTLTAAWLRASGLIVPA